MSFFSLSVIVWLIVRKYLWAVPIVGWTSTMVAIFFVAGLLLANMGMIGLYIGRIFEEVKHRPLYLARSRLGFEPPMERVVGYVAAEPARMPARLPHGAYVAVAADPRANAPVEGGYEVWNGS